MKSDPSHISENEKKNIFSITRLIMDYGLQAFTNSTLKQSLCISVFKGRQLAHGQHNWH